MKKLLFLLLSIALFTACKDDGFQYDPSKMIAIRPSATAFKTPAQFVQSVNPVHLTALEIVQQTTSINIWNEEISTRNSLNRGFADYQKDFLTPMLKMLGTDIIDMDGKYVTAFINGHDVLLRRVTYDADIVRTEHIDTLAYIPNAVIIAARTQIKAAYDNADYETVYSLFNTAFTFTPVTGSEWLALKKIGQN